MSRDARKFIHAAECAERVGKYAFGLNDKKAIQILRQLADDLENGTVVLHSLTTSSCATHEEFAVREVVVEILEELPADQANNAGEVVLLPRFARTPGSD